MRFLIDDALSPAFAAFLQQAGQQARLDAVVGAPNRATKQDEAAMTWSALAASHNRADRELASILQVKIAGR